MLPVLVFRQGGHGGGQLRCSRCVPGSLLSCAHTHTHTRRASPCVCQIDWQQVLLWTSSAPAGRLLSQHNVTL